MTPEQLQKIKEDTLREQIAELKRVNRELVDVCRKMYDMLVFVERRSNVRMPILEEALSVIEKATSNPVQR